MVGRAHRILRRLLLPAPFRDRFGAEMEAVFRAALDGAPGPGERAGLWVREVRDLWTTGRRLRRARRRHGAGFLARRATTGGGVMKSKLEVVWAELRMAVRSLRRSPGFVAAVALTLGLGVGANAAMFEVVDQLLLRPPPFLRSGEEVRSLYFHRTLSGSRRLSGSFSYPAVRELLADVAGADVVMASGWRDQVARIGSERRKVLVLALSGTAWSLFDAVPVAGRFFGPTDDAPPLGEPVAVLSWGFWQREYGGSREVVGRTLEVAGKTYDIVGVAPRGFRALEIRSPDVFVPLTAAAPTFVGDDFAQRAGTTFLTVRIRPEPGSRAIARTSAERVIQAHYADHIGEDRASEWDIEASFQPLQGDRGPYPRDETRLTLWLLGMAAVVFLVAAANVATLVTGRSLRRLREAAVRSAMGIGPGRALLGPLLESTLLAALGALVAVPVGHAAVVGVTRTLLPDAVGAMDGLALRSLLFAGALLLVVVAILSAGPALQARSMDLTRVLRSGGRRAGRTGTRLHAALPVAQATLSAFLLVGAGLFVRSVVHAGDVELGFEPEAVALVDVETSGAFDAFRSAEELGFSMAELHDRAASVPGVGAVALATSTPFLHTSTVTLIREDGSPAPGSGEGGSGGATTGSSTGPGIRYLETMVTPEYFDVMGTPILEGRGIEPGDRDGAEPVVVVSESVARAVWPTPDGRGQRALGRCIHVRTDSLPCHRVIGVAADIRRGDIRETDVRLVYRPWNQGERPFRGLLLVRAQEGVQGPGQLVEPLRRALAPALPGAAMVSVTPMAQQLEAQLRRWSVGARVFTAFGILALVMAAVGIFSVVAWEVAQRRREFGVRMAVGARTEDLLRLVLLRGVLLSGTGVAMGLVGAWVLAGRLQGLLFGVATRDPVTFLAVAALLVGAAAVASLAPAYRATRVDPQAVLQAE